MKFEYIFIFTSILIIFNDIRYRRISNINLVVMLVLSLCISDNYSIDMLYVVVTLFIISISFFYLNAWAGGDGKLLITLAPLFAFSEIVDLIITILFVGGLLSFFYWIKYRLIFKIPVVHGLPYGVAILGGAHLSLYFSQGLSIYS